MAASSSPAWLVEALDVFERRAVLLRVVVAATCVVGALLAVLAPDLVPPRPIVGAAVALAAILLGVAVTIAVDAGDATVRGPRHVRAVGGELVGVLPTTVAPAAADDLAASVLAARSGRRLVLGLGPTNRGLDTSGWTDALAVALAARGASVLSVDLAAGPTPEDGLLEVVRDGASLGRTVTFEHDVKLARLGAGRDLDGAIAAAAELPTRLPKDLEVLLLALPPVDGDVLTVAAALDAVLLLARSDATPRVRLQAAIEAVEGVGTTAQVVLVDDRAAGGRAARPTPWDAGPTTRPDDPPADEVRPDHASADGSAVTETSADGSSAATDVSADDAPVDADAPADDALVADDVAVDDVAARELRPAGEAAGQVAGDAAPSTGDGDGQPGGPAGEGPADGDRTSGATAAPATSGGVAGAATAAVAAVSGAPPTEATVASPASGSSADAADDAPAVDELVSDQAPSGQLPSDGPPSDGPPPTAAPPRPDPWSGPRSTPRSELGRSPAPPVRVVRDLPTTRRAVPASLPEPPAPASPRDPDLVSGAAAAGLAARLGASGAPPAAPSAPEPVIGDAGAEGLPAEDTDAAPEPGAAPVDGPPSAEVALEAAEPTTAEAEPAAAPVARDEEPTPAAEPAVEPVARPEAPASAERVAVDGEAGEPDEDEVVDPTDEIPAVRDDRLARPDPDDDPLRTTAQLALLVDQLNERQQAEDGPRSDDT